MSARPKPCSKARALTPRPCPWSHDTAAAGQLDELKRRAVQPRADLWLQEQQAASSWWAAMRDLAKSRTLVDCPLRAAKEGGGALDQEER